VDWPAPILWPSNRVKWGASAASAARAARLNVYALARLAGWREQAHRFARGPIALRATFLPAHPRHWIEPDALVALAPTLEALGDILDRSSAFCIEAIRADLTPRLGIVVVQVTPSTEGTP